MKPLISKMVFWDGVARWLVLHPARSGKAGRYEGFTICPKGFAEACGVAAKGGW